MKTAIKKAIRSAVIQMHANIISTRPPAVGRLELAAGFRYRHRDSRSRMRAKATAFFPLPLRGTFPLCTGKDSLWGAETVLRIAVQENRTGLWHSRRSACSEARAIGAEC